MDRRQDAATARIVDEILLATSIAELDDAWAHVSAAGARVPEVCRVLTRPGERVFREPLDPR
jgi:hypothetical protein